MLGYVAIGIPCGILCASIGLNALQVFLLSALFYSGAGQFMIPNMWLAGSPLASALGSALVLGSLSLPQAARAKTITRAMRSARNFFIFVPP